MRPNNGRGDLTRARLTRVPLWRFTNGRIKASVAQTVSPVAVSFREPRAKALPNGRGSVRAGGASPHARSGPRAGLAPISGESAAHRGRYLGGSENTESFVDVGSRRRRGILSGNCRRHGLRWVAQWRSLRA